MDKNTLIGLFLIGAIVLTFTLMDNSEEESEGTKTEQTEADSSDITVASDSVVPPIVLENEVNQDSLYLKQVPDSLLGDSVLVAGYLDSIQNEAQQKSLQKELSGLRNEFGIFHVAANRQNEKKYYTIENDKIIVKLSNLGGRIVDVKLKEYQNYKDYKASPDEIQPMQLFEEETSTQSLQFSADNTPVLTGNLLFEAQNAKDIMVVQGGDSVSLVLRLKTEIPDQYVDFKYTLHNGSYEVEHTIEYFNLQKSVDLTNVKFNWQMYGLSTEKLAKDERLISTVMYRYFDEKRDYLSERSDDEEEIGARTNWIAFKHKFFTSAIITEDGWTDGKVAQKQLEDDDYTINYASTVVLPPMNVVKMKFFFGPNEYEVLSSYDNGMEDIINLGWGIFGWVNKLMIQPIFDLLRGTGFALGLIIFLVTLAVKILITPLTYKTYLSSAKMRVLKPAIAKITDKYPNRDQMLKRQQETQALYKSSGVNPMAGCIPSLIQMPILFAVFRFFPSSIHLRHQPFLWADDLSSYDAIASWTAEIPLLTSIYGNHISLFTLLMAASTMIYTIMNSGNMATPTQPGMPNMKVIMYIFPVVMIFFFNSFSAGLSYYYLCGNLFNIGIIFAIKKFFIDEDKIRLKIEENKKKPAKKSKFVQRMEEMQKQQLAAKKKRK